MNDESYLKVYDGKTTDKLLASMHLSDIVYTNGELITSTGNSMTVRVHRRFNNCSTVSNLLITTQKGTQNN